MINPPCDAINVFNFPYPCKEKERLRIMFNSNDIYYTFIDTLFV